MKIDDITKRATRTMGKDRIGETKINNQGLKMKIVEYRKATDLDVMFEDGTIVYNKRYANFKSGAISKEVIKIGSVFKNKKGLEFEVINRVYLKEHNRYGFDVKFKNTGYVKRISKSALLKGAVKDVYDKNIYGVASKGVSSSKYPLLNKIAFKRWYAMVDRCYNTNAANYKSYGGKGVVVCERWLLFDNFLSDIIKIEGYDYYKYINWEIELDKDTRIRNNKEYSYENCRFISKRDNRLYQPSKRRLFMATSPNGETNYYYLISECARINGLDAKGINRVLLNKQDNYKNWSFKYMSNEKV